MVGIVEAGGDKISRRKYRPNSVTFSDNEEIINPGIYTVCVCVSNITFIGILFRVLPRIILVVAFRKTVLEIMRA